MTAAWKDLERRICHALGGRRGGPTGAAVSDCVNVPFAVEIKRTKVRPVSPEGVVYGPPVYARWIWQAQQQAKRERKPWLVVVAGHNDRRPVACLDFWQFAQLCQQAGVIPEPLDVS